ncbi:MAG: Cellulase [Candidatus Gottesmanbacteria bacterium GW2011_GWB1_49_7]|uniref:Methyltransferase n=1 Tax=Candidatus Gottesmanbacteria bacterium GW2011_GWB1_49_7 TaxID=1618448 RepID=A0A0G1W1I6_9BACT|nr:MAG: Cellulase [Candidatus Gottesmanbacteria bacterium GW2011_GWB1_49_7]
MELDYRVGNVLDELQKMPDESVHCIVTSPPYFGLRDYKSPPTIWGGDPNCQHDFEMVNKESKIRTGLGLEKLGEQYRGGGKKQGKLGTIKSETGFCQKCGAWKGHLGLEPTIELYVQHLVTVFEECKRVLRKDGTFFINIGDSYAGGGGSSGHTHETKNFGRKTNSYGAVATNGKVPIGLKPKDLCMIPARVAIALQAAGWWIRNDIIWEKRNCMPESCRDRFTKSPEYVFFLTKSAKYYSDMVAVKEPSRYPDDNRKARASASHKRMPTELIAGIRPGSATYQTRNARTVWSIATQPCSLAHFAVFPMGLPTRCIKAGSPSICCGICGAPWKRIIKKTGHVNKREPAHQPGNTETKVDSTGWAPTSIATDEFQPTCKHNDNTGKAVVLDPFVGRGTTLLVADNLGRLGIGIDISAEYKKLAIEWIASEKEKQAKKSKKPRPKKAIESEIIPTPFFPDVASPEDSKSKPNGKTLEDFE